ncbi:MAG TPA: hypothetical protein PLG90_04650 [Ignavibacteria bacterium]|nr:hypothetical protein [Ignavibacteria bacterium]
MKILFITLLFISLSCNTPEDKTNEPKPRVELSDEERIMNLESENDRLQTENQDMEDEINSLELRILELESEVEELTDENNDLINEINYLNGY